MKKNPKTSKLPVLKNIAWLFRMIWKYTPGYVIWMLAEGIIWGIHHAIGIIYAEKLFNAIGNQRSFEEIAGIISIYAVYLLFFWVFHQWYWHIYNPKCHERLHVAMHSDMFRQAVSIDLAKYDDPKFYNDFVWAMDQSYSHAVGLMEDTGKLINRIVASCTLTSLLFTVDEMMAVIIFVMAGIQILLSLVTNKTSLKYTNELNPLNRKDGYINRVFKLPDYAKELRITHVSENLFHEHNRNVEDKKAVVKKYECKIAGLQFLTNALNNIGKMGLIILVLYKIMVSGELGLGGFVVAINASWKMTWLLRDMVSRILKYHEHSIFIAKMFTFLTCKPTICDGKHVAETFESLEIRNLKFSYEGECGKKVLDDISLTINKGEKIAIVGYNGAGKTTLTKLIMRLYDTTDGEICYNGKPLKEYTVESLRNHVAAVFQDYRIFACSIAENVIGGKYNEDSENGVLAALEMSTFDYKLASLKAGIHTKFTREFDEDGTQLSGGEQQKIAIARAFFKDADLIILDEPSSALDPDAEYNLNKSIAKYADTKTVIFISHRLSTTRHADRIYMFDNGKLIESGTHDELMAQDGKYAYMFKLQAEKYR